MANVFDMDYDALVASVGVKGENPTATENKPAESAETKPVDTTDEYKVDADVFGGEATNPFVETTETATVVDTTEAEAKAKAEAEAKAEAKAKAEAEAKAKAEAEAKSKAQAAAEAAAKADAETKTKPTTRKRAPKKATKPVGEKLMVEIDLNPKLVALLEPDTLAEIQAQATELMESQVKAKAEEAFKALW